MQNHVLILVILLLLSAVPATAQSAAELLEKGIYLEETAGQVDEAIEIYRRILDDATADRAHVAEALLRLGTCHLKQGDPAAATGTFKRLFTEYPEQEELAARAREQLPLRVPGEEPLELLAAPWEDGEVNRLIVKLASGVTVGVLFMTADATEVDGEELWRLQMRHQFFSDTRNQTVRQVLARRDTMAPVSSFYRYPGVGHFEARYSDGKVSIDTLETGARREEKLDGPTFDAEEMFHLFRRLPLTVGGKHTLRLISTMAGGANAAELEVEGIEMITVPAGEFECYRLKLAGMHLFWVSTGPGRSLVKLDAAGLVVELEEIYVREPGRRSAFGDEELGLRVDLPPDWLAHRRQGTEVVHLLDPKAETQSRMEIRRAREDGGNCIFYAAMRQKLEQARTSLGSYELRKGSWSERRVAGWPAVSFAGNYRGVDGEMVDYWTFIENQEFCVDFTLKVSAGRFEALRDVFDRLIAGYEAPPPEVAEVPEPEAAVDVRAVLDDFHRAAAQTDVERAFEHLAGDAVFFGLDTADRFTTAELRERFAEVAPWLGDAYERHVLVSAGGELAWFDERLETRELGELRASGVLRRANHSSDAGPWRIVQYQVGMHLPVELLPKLLPIVRAHREVEGLPIADPGTQPCDSGAQPCDSGAQPCDSGAQPCAPTSVSGRTVSAQDESADAPADDPAATAGRLLHDIHHAATVADAPRFFAAFAPEAMIFGSTARLTLARYRALREPYLARGQGLPSTLLEHRIHLSSSGELAWFEELVNVFDHDRLRGTGVMRRVDGDWKLVHYSAMILVPRQLAGDLAERVASFYAPDG